MRGSIFSLVGLLVIVVALYVGYKFGSQIPILNSL
jgi:hypothetical protein